MADKVKVVEIDQVKEKLMELMFEGQVLADAYCDKQDECDKCPHNAPNGCRWGAIADHLIANGVTVQRWIPVTERLPDSCKCVLIYTENGVAEGSYSAYNKSWVQFRWNAKDIKVTHWMPLPEPPEGE